MSPNSLELEDGLKDIGKKLSSPPSDSQQLLLHLDKAENLLSRVEQSPSASMFVALRPCMNALIAKDLLGHSDMDVKVAIASCLSEITRITAPDAPYDDDKMKEIFGLIVGAFKKLDDMSSRSFPKRISVLETVAKVRSCVLMLDLDCDDLILEMFHHFLKTIRSTHSDAVFSSMEIVMTLVLEETESISTRLLSCILDYLKIVEKNILPAAKKLAEKVLVNCSLKLKPCLDELFNGNGALLSDYSQIVAAVFQGNLDTSMQNETNASGENHENRADDHKLAERTLSDDLPQGSAQQESENFHPEQAVAAADKSTKSLMSNGSFQIGNGTAKRDGRSNLKSCKGGRNALLKLSIRNDHYGVGNRKKARVNSGRGKGSSKEAEIVSQADGSSKEVESTVCSKNERKNELELTSDSPDVVASVFLDGPNGHDGTRPRRGRLSQSSGKRNDVDKAAAGGLNSTGHKEFLSTSQGKSMELPVRDLISNESEGLGDSEIKQLTGSAKKSRSGRAKDDKGNVKDSNSTPTTATSDCDTPLLSNRGRNGSQRKVRLNSSEKKQIAGTKQQKGVRHSEADDKELKLKELLSSQKSRVKELVKDHNHVKDASKTKSGKLARGTQENFGPRKRRKGLDDTVIGSKIKIWWPDDQRFYDGVVDSFDQSTNMHKILYDDGDVEVLLLKKELWEFIEGENKMDGEKDKPDLSASEPSKKAKGSTVATIDKTTDVPLKSSSDSPAVSVHLSKHRTRRRVKIHSDDLKSSSLTKEKSRNKHSEESHKDNVVKDTPKKNLGKSNGNSSRSTSKSKKSIHKSMKKSGVSNDSVTKTLEGSPKPESAQEHLKPKPKFVQGRRKPARMQGKVLIQKGKGGMKPRIIRTSGNSQSKPGRTDASSYGKKRKRARIGK